MPVSTECAAALLSFRYPSLIISSCQECYLAAFLRLSSHFTRQLLRRHENHTIRIEFLFTHKNGDFGAISVTERRRSGSISSVESHMHIGQIFIVYSLIQFFVSAQKAVALVQFPAQFEVMQFIKRLLNMKERTDYVQNNLPLLSTMFLLMCFSVFGYCVVYHRLKARERERFVLKSALPVKVCLIMIFIIDS